MNTPTNIPTNAPQDDHDDAELRQLYRQLPQEEPTGELDRRILAAVGIEVAATEQRQAQRDARWQVWRRWQVPLATAATVVLAVSLLLQQRSMVPGLADNEAAESATAPEAAAGILAKQHGQEPPPAPMPVPVPVVPLELPAPASVATPVPAPAEAPMAAAPPPPVPPALPESAVADNVMRFALIDESPLARLVRRAEGLPAAEFCTRLTALWTSDAPPPECPVTEGMHEWPMPLAVHWEVVDGMVRRATLPPSP